MATIRLSAYSRSEPEFSPGVGERDAEVLRDWLGVSDAEIAGLRESRVI